VASVAPGPLARSQRAALRRALEDGTVAVSDLCSGNAPEPDETVALNMTVRDLLAHSPARDSVAAVLETARLQDVPSARRLGELTIAQRLRLSEALEATSP
jgi:hypothetical protein